MTSNIIAWSTAVCLSVIALLAPIHALLATVSFLLAADFVLGIAAAVKRGESLTSKAASRTVYKALGYNLAVISGFALEGLVPGALPITKLCAATIGLVEAKSIAESVHTLTGVDLRSIIETVSSRGRPPPPP